jgi:di/tricarboxylate transporter
MTLPQIELFALLAFVLGLLLWGRIRHDLVAACGLLLAVVLGVVPESKAFAGFSHSAVLIVALVLVASRAFENSGALSLVTQRFIKADRPLALHIAVTGSVGAALSAVINNVAALALLMPVDIQAAQKAGRSPRLTLMPLAFATILGGLVTLIGTPPNIIASSLRARELGAPYQMFDFAPVGLAVAVAGLIFVAMAGWRLIPQRGDENGQAIDEEEFTAELVVPEDSSVVGKYLSQLDGDAEGANVVTVGLVRNGRRLPFRGRVSAIEHGDALVVEGPTDGIADFIKRLGLQPYKESKEKEGAEKAPQAEQNDADAAKDADHLLVAKAVVRAESSIAGQSARSFNLRSRFDVTLLGIAHRGRTYREQVLTRRIEAGDVLLIAGSHGALTRTMNWLSVIPISEVSIARPRLWRIAVAVGLFAAAVVAATSGWLSFTVAIMIAVVGYAATGLVPAREFYEQIDWSVIVMLACLLPLGEAFHDVGGTALAADVLLFLTQGQSPIVALVLLMVVTMTLSDVLNNVATMVIAGPLGLTMAAKLGVNPDTFLMGTAIAASCAFLTPIGHKNNTLIMGPGGYAFADYWRMGLPLEAIVLAVGVPVLLVVWPLGAV